MYKIYKNVDFVIDDELYFFLAQNNNLPGNITPARVKHDQRLKYPKKLLVWLAVSPEGVSKPFYRPSGIAINQWVHKEALEKHLKPLLRANYPNGGYVFWPDLASSHYAHRVVDYLKSENIELVPKEMNPANVPYARSIEDFWAEPQTQSLRGRSAVSEYGSIEAQNRDVLETARTSRRVMAKNVGGQDVAEHH